MPVIDITDATFARLQRYATPLVDTPETALIKVLDLADAAGASPATAFSESPAPQVDAPDLTHTTLTSAAIDGRSVAPALCYWNNVMMAVIERAAEKSADRQATVDLIVVNKVSGQKEDNGYKYVPSLDVSVQCQNSNNAWKAIDHIALATGIKVDVSFVWGSHPKAARPGQRGRLSV